MILHKPVQLMIKVWYLLWFISDIEQGFMPWLMDQVQTQLKKSQLGRLVLDGLLREVVSQRFDAYSKLDPPAPGSRSASAKPDDSKPVDSSNNAAEQPPAAATTSEVRLVVWHWPNFSYLGKKWTCKKPMLVCEVVRWIEKDVLVKHCPLDCFTFI